MSPARETGNDRVLRFLRDGRWHTSSEIRRACEVTVNSRISELRKRGCVIALRRNGGREGAAAYSYRLLYEASPVPTTCGRSSTEERLAAGEEVAGSSPAARSTPTTSRSISDIVTFLRRHGFVEVELPVQPPLFSQPG